MACPVGWHESGGTGYRLIDGMVMRRLELRPGDVLVGGEVVEPVLSRLEAPHDGVARVSGVPAGVLRR